MKRRNFIKLTGYIITTSLLPKTALCLKYKNTSKQPLIIGIFPRRNIKLTHKIFTPLAEFLSNNLNREVKLVTTKNFKMFWEGVKNHDYDIVHYNQYHYIISHLLYNYQVILRNQEFGSNTVRSSIIVRKDSNINTIMDLQNKTILFGGGQMAMQSYIAARWLLEQGGLNKGDYIEKFAINPPNAIMSTYHKQADAAGSGDVILKLDSVRSRIDTTQMKFLSKSPPLTHLPWAVKSNLDASLILKIQKILSSSNTHAEGRKILAKAKLSALEPATDKEYDKHREIISDIYGKDYGIETFK